MPDNSSVPLMQPASSWQVHKFGGAAMADAHRLEAVATYLSTRIEAGEKVIVVVSAMGKTTNLLELVIEQARAHLSVDLATKVDPSLLPAWQTFTSTHRQVAHTLEIDPMSQDPIPGLEAIILEGEWALSEATVDTVGSEAFYDRIVSLGELVSSVMLMALMSKQGHPAITWWDARRLIITDAAHRSARVDRVATRAALTEARERSAPLHTSSIGQIVITQGFIGSVDGAGATTTLGREGSDYTAALVAEAIGASALVAWKDVPGIFSADPKAYPGEALPLPKLSYALASEMTYYGAHVIHPKTLQPLDEGRVPLLVRSFLDPDAPGTVVGADWAPVDAPLIMQRGDVVLISCYAHQIHHLATTGMGAILEACHQVGLQVLLCQTSAVSVSVVVPRDRGRAQQLIDTLEAHYRLVFNEGLTLFTLKFGTEALEKKVLADRPVILAQRTRSTVHLLTGPPPDANGH